MRHRRVYQIMLLLNEEEVRLFRHFLVSPLFPGGKTLLRFFELWEERVLQAPTTTDLEVEVFLDGSGFQVSRFDKLCSQLQSRLLEFLVFQEFQRDDGVKYDLAWKALEARGASESELYRQQERHRKWLEKQSDSAWKQMKMLELVWRRVEGKISTRQTQALWKEDFRELHEMLDDYYYLQKLKLASASANVRQMYKQEEDPASVFLRFFRDAINPEVLSPLGKAYYHTIEILSNSDALGHFRQLIQTLQENAADFEIQDARELYSYALNFTIRKGNQGESVYRDYTGFLYRDLLDKGLLLVDGRLPSQVMKNIVVIHCRLGQLEWAADFVAAYQDRLSEGTDPAIITYNQAVLAYFQKDYPGAIAQLKEVVSQLKDDIFYELDARSYLWKSYFEAYEALSLQEVDEMEKMYDSFRLLIDRNKRISLIHKLQYRNFIREFKRLMVLFQQKDLPHDLLKAFRTDLEGMDNIVNRDWLIQRVDGLLGHPEK